MAARFLGEAFLNSLFGVLFDRLVSPVIVNLIQGKKLNRKLVERLETTLNAARAVLNDAEQKQITDKAVKKWLSDLKDAVYKADDLLDEVSTVAQIEKLPGNSKSRYLNLHHREIGNRMEEIIDTLEEIVQHKDILGLNETKENMSWRITTSLVETSDIYGRKEDKEKVIKLLLDDTCDAKLSVIPIVGIGGIGKTTLAQLIYNDGKVKQNFDFHAWVCVSDEFDVVKVTRTIIEAITFKSCETNGLNLLQHELKEKLTGRKFLIVLDDTWSEDCVNWNKLLQPFQHGVKGSKILLTTRSTKVASVVQTVPPHELRSLSDDDCWLVFAKHALLSSKSIENSTIEKIGREIVRKCKGLPLAAQTLGSLLRGNCDVRYWNHILNSEIWELSEDSSKIISALRISYYYLPSSLKECFVFCSLYPKDYHFNKEELILMWMAEGILQLKGRKTLEELGYEYFDELVARSFFQRFSTNSSVFVMHDLIHDLATFYAEEFYFRVEELENAAKIGTIDIKTRHLSLDAKCNNLNLKLSAACDRAKYIRTFLLQSELYTEDPLPLCPLVLKLKYLRVLSFKRLSLNDGSLPDSIGELIHLRYLNLSYTPVVTLPESLSNLHNLQTLKLNNCSKLKMLPSRMQDLVNLRHLDIRGTYCLKEMPRGMSKLKDLHFLSGYTVGKHEENGIKEFGALTSLCGSLTISSLQNVENSFEASEARMFEKERIDVLNLSWSSDEDGRDIMDSQTEVDILDKLRPYTDLKVLSIEGYRGTKFPDWLGDSSYHNMTELKLKGCSNCFMFPSLGQLPSLKDLEISGFDKLVRIGGACLPASLQRLKISKCRKLEFPMEQQQQYESLRSLKIDDSCDSLTCFPLAAFPNLEELVITRCENMKYLDEVSQSQQEDATLPSLRYLTITDCPSFVSLLSQSRNAALPRLRYLNIRDCPSLVSLSTIGLIAPQLEDLHISSCPEIDSLTDGDEGLPPNLRHLRIFSCDKLVRCLLASSSASTVLHNTHSLTSLGITITDACDSIKSFPKEDCLPPSLEYLHLESFPSLEMLDCNGLVHLTSLQRLSIGFCSKLENMAGERLPPSLKYLTIIGCPLLGERFNTKDPQIWPKVSHIPEIIVDGRFRDLTILNRDIK